MEIKIGETEYKLSMMADDTTLIVKNLDSFDSAIKIFNKVFRIKTQFE